TSYPLWMPITEPRHMVPDVEHTQYVWRGVGKYIVNLLIAYSIPIGKHSLPGLSFGRILLLELLPSNDVVVAHDVTAVNCFITLQSVHVTVDFCFEYIRSNLFHSLLGWLQCLDFFL